MTFPKIEGYVVTEKLGSGSYSTVYKAYTKVGARSIVAVKCVDKSRIKNSGSAVDNLITEIRLLKTLTHPHIVNMKHFTWDDRNIYIIMEYCCGGDLSKYIQRYGRVPEKQVLYFLQQLASALKFLREKGVVHMDLKPHNLLLHKGSDGKYTLKVADFGFAQYLCSERGGGVRGSPLYMAPEMLAGAYDARVDLWSVGVIMYECLFGKAPYSSNTFKELVDKIQNQEKIQIPPNSSISAGCRDLLSRLLKHDPDERISYEDFFNHEYLDLEHMPSKENYEKAVALMSRAVQLDGSARACSDAAARVGLLRGALELYRASLRHLVPSARAEPDAVRRGALSDKLTRYMERAEEIKEYLKCLERNVSPSLPPAGAAAGFGNTVPASTCSYTYGTVEEPACASYSRVSADRNGTVDITCRSNTGPDISAARVHSAQVTEPVDEKRRAMQAVEASGANDRPRTPPRFGIKRLFGKISALPTLTNSDSSLADDSSNKEKVDNQDGASEGCRIT